MKYISESSDSINAECEKCHRFLIIKKEACTLTDNGYSVSPPIRCECKNISSVIKEVKTSQVQKITTGQAVLIIIALLVVWVISGLFQSPTKNNKPRDYSSMAAVQCRNFVRDRLKSPSTADFPYDPAQNVGDNTFAMYSHVDAENSFGAKLRTNFYCKVRFTGGDEVDRNNWNLIEINIDE